MEEDPSPPGLPSLQARIIANLKLWSPFEWIFFWAGIPAILLLVYAIPQNIKNEFFILNTANPWAVPAYFLSAYTHSELFWHLIGNVAFYFVTLLVIFACENNRQRFRIMCLCAFLLVPVITAVLTLSFFGVLGRTVTSQGFSSVDGAFLAYAIFILATGIVQDGFERLDFPELFAGKQTIYYITISLLVFMLGSIVYMGIIFGEFVNPGGQVVNGLAHFGGFITGLIVLLTYDVLTEKRKIFQVILTVVILMGIIWYVKYLGILIGSPG
jgi:hypothetical protein